MMDNSRHAIVTTRLAAAACLVGVLLLGFVAQAAAARDLAVHVTNTGGEPLAYAALQLDWAGDKPLPVPARPLTMRQKDIRFQPHMLIVPAGSQVRFPNDDQTRHHVYSFSKAKQFDIKLYVGTPDRPIRFPTPGVVTLGCNIHDQMQAFLIVTDAAAAAITDAQGVAHFTDLPDKPLTLRIWHPWMATEEQRVTETIAADASDTTVVLRNLNPPPPSNRDDSLQRRFDALTH